MTSGTVRLPVAGVWAGIVGALALALVTWTLGNNLGYDRGKADQIESLGLGGNQGGTISDPLRGGTSGLGAGGSGLDGSGLDSGTGRAGNQTAGIDSGRGAGVPVLQAGFVINGSGQVVQDPREPGNNYLALAQMPRESAVLAVRYLDVNGSRAVAVPVVDSSIQQGNNRDRFTVYSLDLAVPGGRYSEFAQQRRTVEQRISRLGQQWMRDDGGVSDFRNPQWTRYNGP